MRKETQLLGGPRPFPTTRWSLVRGARGDEGRAALEELCRKYWSPVYFSIRRNWNASVEEAKDLAQEFFLRFLEKDFLRSVDADRGRFRSFLCAALRHFLLNERRREAAVKRTPVAPPEPDFDADWKRALVEAALARLRGRAAGEGKERLVEALVRYELENFEGTYEDLAREFGLTIHQVTNGLHWARQAFKEACLDELRETVETEADFEDEARRVFG